MAGRHEDEGGAAAASRPAGHRGRRRSPDGKALFSHRRRTRLRLRHTLADAGAKGTVGPDLDKVLKGKDAAFIQKSIEDPGAFVEKGFQDGIMPTNYGDTLQPEQI